MFLILVTRIGGSGYIILRVARKNFVTDNLTEKPRVEDVKLLGR